MAPEVDRVPLFGCTFDRVTLDQVAEVVRVGARKQLDVGVHGEVSVESINNLEVALEEAGLA